ncbi:MAG TPA: hypothetical protein VMT73_12590 [Anaerolineales bacterium]|nr:hypothetical protein [Anaerolineales bacterium]
MKKFSIITVFVLFALLLSSCSMHLGLSKLLNSGSPTKSAKHIKATHTPPSPSSTGAASPTPMPTTSGYQPNSVAKVESGHQGVSAQLEQGTASVSQLLSKSFLTS